MFYCKVCQKAIPEYTGLVFIPHTRVGIYSAYHKDCIDKILPKGDNQ